MSQNLKTTLNLHIDNCSHCACITFLNNYTSVIECIEDLECGITGCDNCIDDDAEDYHTSCVVLYIENDAGRDIAVWDGRCVKEDNVKIQPEFIK